MNDAPPVLPPPPLAEGDDTLPESCVECGRTFTRAGMIRYGTIYICPNCKPVFLQKLAEGAQLEKGAFRYAGFWIRFAAIFIDGFIVGIPAAILIMFYLFSNMDSLEQLQDPNTPAAWLATFTMVLTIGVFFLRLLYDGLLVGRFAATPGKMACGLKVVMADGEKVSYGRSFGRSLGKAVLRFHALLYLGFLTVAFDKQKRAPYDFLCKTRVIYK